MKGEFVGGCDIVREMFQADEIQAYFTEKGIAVAQTASRAKRPSRFVRYPPRLSPHHDLSLPGLTRQPSLP